MDGTAFGVVLVMDKEQSRAAPAFSPIVNLWGIISAQKFSIFAAVKGEQLMFVAA